MKTTIAIIILIIGSVIIFACTTQNTTVTEVVVIRDITDSEITQPKPNDIIPSFDLDNYQWNGAKFRFIDITNVSYNYTFEANIKTENNWMGNEFDRKKKVKSFYDEVSRIFTEKNKEAIGKDNSEIYAPLARELNRLHKSTSDKKTILIFSDLMENTKGMSFYDKENLDLLKKNPDSIRKYFEAQVPLGNLQGIKIYIIYQPNNIKENEQFKIVSGFYKNILESKNAQVEIAANIN